MSSRPSGSKIKTALTADELRVAVEWFRDSYKSGWRPSIWAPAHVEPLARKIDAIYAESHTGASQLEEDE